MEKRGEIRGELVYINSAILLALRLASKTSLKDAAWKSRLPAGTIEDWEKGRYRRANLRHLERYVTAMGWDLALIVVPARKAGAKKKAPAVKKAAPADSQLAIPARPAPPVAPKPPEEKAPPPERPAHRLISKTFRLTPEQVIRLDTVALRWKMERGHGKADASEVLRDILDQWMAANPSREAV